MSSIDRITEMANGFSDWDGPEYEKQMNCIGDFIITEYSTKSPQFEEVLKIGLSALSKNTGHHEALDILEDILDKLFDTGIINSKEYDRVVKGSACGRWM